MGLLRKGYECHGRIGTAFLGMFGTSPTAQLGLCPNRINHDLQRDPAGYSLLTYPAVARIARCEMQKKLTITIDEEVYEGLHKIIGPRKISRFVQEIVRPHVVRPNLEAAYAEMAKDKRREKEAEEWAESTFKDVANETT
jgi:hypothetical protein